MYSPRMLPSDIRQSTRHLSCIVYLLLYPVIGVREIIGILNSLLHGDANPRTNEKGVGVNDFEARPS